MPPPSPFPSPSLDVVTMDASDVQSASVSQSPVHGGQGVNGVHPFTPFQVSVVVALVALVVVVVLVMDVGELDDDG